MSVVAVQNNLADVDQRKEDFEALVIEHVSLLFAVAMKMTRNKDDAEDLVQNTVVKALRFRHKFEPGSYIKAWLLTILRNTFINEYRRNSRRPITVELTGTEPSHDKSIEPSIPFLRKEKKREHLLECLGDNVKASLDSLPDEFRTPVIMADLEDSSYQEIADHMGCPIGTVMSRIHRGRKLLREQLRSYACETGLLTA